jgi:mannitol/fructose-specific phosphotransferase system IIA component (Ntr-type)
VVKAAEAEAPVQPITRIANNVASGIAQAARENRITDIIIGWNNARPRSGVIFGGVIDQVLAASDQQVLVCRLGHEVTTSKRLMVVLPPMVDVSPGFFNAVSTLKQLSNQLGLPLEVLAVEGDPDGLGERFAEVKSEAVVEITRLDGWATLMTRLETEMTLQDLLVIVSSRPGTLAHSATLDRLPAWCARLELSFIMLYLNEQVLAARLAANKRADGLPKLLSEKRLFFNLTTRNLAESVDVMLGDTFDLSNSDVQYAKRALLEDDVGFAKERLPQIVIMHARNRAVKKPVAFFGIHPVGVTGADGETIHGMAILLSPLKLSIQEHLTLLSELTHALVRAKDAQSLRLVTALPALRDWFNAKADADTPEDVIVELEPSA